MELTAEQSALIEKHLELVIEINKTLNLTRIDSLESGRIRHIEDSLAALPEVIAAPEGPAADLGTGGGFPGIPLAIATGRHFTLVDSVGKKVRALDGVIDQLELANQIDTYAGRIEDLARERREAFSLVTARALTALPSLLELASPLLKQGGHLIAYKAHYEEELAATQPIQRKLAMKHLVTREFELSDGSPRAILVFERSGNPSIKLPRRVGMAQHQPLER